VVFTYFIATGKWIQHAIAVKHLPGELAAPTRSFKAQAFPAALAAMTFTAATAVLGAAHDSYGLSAHWHHAAAIGTIALNAAVAIAEYHAISRNGRLIDDILGRIQREQSAAA
jgi:tellurite resistance protein TehA-like permease